MTIEEIKSAVCKWITSLGETAVQMPSNHPATKGRYFAVDVTYVSQYGNAIKALGNEGDNVKGVAQYVASVVIHEVDGDGDVLRRIRNDVDGEAFNAFIHKRFQDGSGKDTAFSVWDVGDLNELNASDGDFFVRQWAFNFRVCFNDFIEFVDGENYGKVKSVSGQIGADEIFIERS